jgi:hypothetical protein
VTNAKVFSRRKFFAPLVPFRGDEISILAGLTTAAGEKVRPTRETQQCERRRAGRSVLECGDLSPLSRGDLSPSSEGMCWDDSARSRLAPAVGRACNFVAVWDSDGDKSPAQSGDSTPHSKKSAPHRSHSPNLARIALLLS